MNTLNGKATFKPLAYANLEIAPDDPEAFDIEYAELLTMEVSDVFPPINCFVVEYHNTECDRANYCHVYNTIAEACTEFKELITKCNVTKVAISDDIDNYLYDDGPYVPCSTYGDYSPSNPWDAPGMSVRDFI